MGNLKRCSILKEGNTHYSDSSKPLDKLFDDMDNLRDKFFKDMDKALPKEITYISRLEQEVTTLKTSLSKAGELIEELKEKNKLQKAQLRKFGKIFDNFSGQEVDAEFNEEEFNNNKKGESDGKRSRESRRVHSRSE